MGAEGTTFAIALPFNANIELNLFNLRGEKVATVVRKFATRGVYEFHWDGRNDGGEKAAFGVYFAQVGALSTEQNQKKGRWITVKR